MDSTIGRAAQSLMSAVVDTAKVKDLNKDKVLLEKGPSLTTDYGAKVSDTDNW